MKNINLTVKSIPRTEKIKVGILAHFFVTMVSIYKLFWIIQ